MVIEIRDQGRSRDGCNVPIRIRRRVGILPFCLLLGLG